MWLAIGIFAFVVVLIFAIDFRVKLSELRIALDNRTIEEIIRLLKIWQKDSEIFCEQMQHDRNNKIPTLNSNMAAHGFRSWLDSEIATVGYLNKIWKPEINFSLKKRIEETFDAQTCEYIQNCFPGIYRR